MSEIIAKDKVMLKILLWVIKFMRKYPRMFRIRYIKMRSLLFQICIKLYKPKYFYWKNKNKDPETSAYNGCHIWDFGEICLSNGEGGHPAAVSTLCIESSKFWNNKMLENKE
jgi:hypothetical protein